MIDDALAAYCIDGDKEVRTRGIACGDYCPRTGVQICKTLHIWMSAFSDVHDTKKQKTVGTHMESLGNGTRARVITFVV